LIIHGRRISSIDLEKAESMISTTIDDAFKRASTDPFPELKGPRRS
jgi:hypothetical protein